MPALLVPWAIRHTLHRPNLLPAGFHVDIGSIRFNPWTLNLGIQQLVLRRTSGADIADVERIDTRLSWRSLWYRVPVIGRLRILQPQIQLSRLPSGKLDIDDLLAPLLAPSTGPLPQFAIANIELINGRVDMNDQILQRRHRLDQLQLAIPLLANIGARPDLEVRPRLDLRMDGAPLHIEASTLPFASQLRSRAHIQLQNADLAAWLPYLPVALPLAIPSGRLSGDLQLDYDAGRQPASLQLQGQLQLRQLQIQTANRQPLLDLASADIELTDVDPLQGRYRLGRISLDQPRVKLQLDAGGHLPWLDALTRPAATAPTAIATPPLATTGTVATPATAAPTTIRAPELAIAGIELHQAQLEVRRAGMDAPLQISQLQLTLGSIASSNDKAVPLHLSAHVGSGGDLQLDSHLQWQALRASGTAQVKNLALAPWLAWLPAEWRHQLQLDGRLDSLTQFKASLKPSLQLQLGTSRLSLRDVKLQRLGLAPLQWQRLDLQLNTLDLSRRHVDLADAEWQGLQLTARKQDDSLDLLQGWSFPSGTAARSGHVTAAAPWSWQLGRFTLSQAQLQLQQEGDDHPQPLQLDIRQLRLQHLSSKAGSQAELNLDAVTGHRGTIKADGPVGLSPVTAQLMLQMDRVDLAPIQDLVPLPLQIQIQSARMGGKGRLLYHSAHQYAFQGDARLNHVQIKDLTSGGPLLRWSHLQLDGLQLRRHRGQTRVDIQQIGLANFYARVIVNPDGHTNLERLLAAPNEVTTTTTISHAAAPANVTGGIASVPALQVSASLPMQLHIGGIRMLQGQLNYSDNFVRPHFNADVTGLQGRIGSFGNLGGAPADLALFGTLNQLSPVLIEGKIDPLAPDAFADVTGTANSVPLPNLSTYSSRYTGYPITSGLLNADVHYILKNGRLQAENHLLISQLTFGPAVTTPGVAHLPVKLAIALLKNSRGEIDIRLPVSGSLSDPQFSISDLFWHAMRDLVGRAVSSPFRLLASAFGDHSGPRELGQLRFAPGSAELDATAIGHLQKLATMLKQRPSLNLDITGRADPVADVQGLREHWVDNEIRSEYHRQHIDADGPMPKLPADEYHDLLVKVYHRDRFKKPRNFLGMEKTPSDAAMMAAIKEHAGIGEHQLQNLASKRALAVAGWMHGKINDTRVSLHVPLISSDDGKKHASDGTAAPEPVTRVDLGLH